LAVKILLADTLYLIDYGGIALIKKVSQSKEENVSKASSVENSLSEKRVLQKIEGRMRNVLELLGLELDVCYAPNKDMPVYGEIRNKIIYIYASNKKAALETFEHELLEYKFKETTRVYRSIVNSLIDVLEKEVYDRKEAFIDFLPRIHRAIKEIEADETSTKFSNR
jgi:hypothetical protein